MRFIGGSISASRPGRAGVSWARSLTVASRGEVEPSLHDSHAFLAVWKIRFLMVASRGEVEQSLHDGHALVAGSNIRSQEGRVSWVGCCVLAGDRVLE